MHVYEIIEANVDNNPITLPKGSKIVQKSNQQSPNKTPSTPIPSDAPSQLKILQILLVHLRKHLKQLGM